MSSRMIPIGSLCSLLLLTAGCAPAVRLRLTEQTGGNAALVGQFQAYDGQSGRVITFRDVVDRCRRADVILFGEQHSDAVCNQLEAQLLYALAAEPRPLSLAMEFFETDTQAALDAYLLGRIDEAAFREQTRQGRAYVLSHRPLIELCRAADIPVIAANAPRRLVRAYRHSGQDYTQFRTGLEAADRRWLPATNEHLGGGYERRFLGIMGAHQPTTRPQTMPATQPAAKSPAAEAPERMYAAQLLWDQAMAESLAAFRTRFPAYRLMLIVGSFHVEHAGGTVIKFQRQRPRDRVLTIVYRGTTDGRFTFADEDRDAGDVVIYGIVPPPEPKREQPPTTMPATQPTAAPTTAAATQEVTTRPEPTEPRREIVIRDVLVVGKVGKGGRAAVHTDAIEAQIVAGTWTPPAAGQSLELPDGATRTWQAASAGDDGVIRHEALAGGYAYAAIEAEHEEVMILDARGHSMVYANGEPRAGDPYQWGFVRLPVLLRAGTNHFLFACGRGELYAMLVEPRAAVMLDFEDATLPDLVAGEPTAAGERWAAVVIVNAAAMPLSGARLLVRAGSMVRESPVPSVPALTVRKVGFSLPALPVSEPGKPRVELVLADNQDELDRATAELSVLRPDEPRRCTFVSAIDGSVQYYALQPACPSADAEEKPALFMSLHGAGVEALGQVRSYVAKSWGHVVAPTNRRPYGFDWEDWGRVDALEVLELAKETLGTDPRRTYLTGHSMGGHGTWQIGAHYPDRFAAIGPSAGWISFWSYGIERAAPTSLVEQLLARATNPSDTLGLSRNYLHFGVYVLHGSEDDNVPVEQARTMRKHLANYHGNWAYYEQPGAGHWWDLSAQPGVDCVDWGPLFDFLRQNVRPAAHTVRHVEFVTANPAISATCHWATIEQQVRCLDFSTVNLTVDPQSRVIRGATENVARLALTLKLETEGKTEFVVPPDAPVTIELDGDRLESVSWPVETGTLYLVRPEGHWQTDAKLPSRLQKTPKRSGPFKAAFDHRVQFVYGTRGSPAETAWAYAKARYDAETFWVRGNGAIDVLADTEFEPDAQPDRNVVLYGNADTNSAWHRVLPNCPVQVHANQVRVGTRELAGDDLAILALYPRPRSDQALVGIVAGSGLVGMRLTERLPYFVSGVAYPDWIVLGPEMLESGTGGVRATGFFGNDWQLDEVQSAWAQP